MEVSINNKLTVDHAFEAAPLPVVTPQAKARGVTTERGATGFNLI